MAAVRRVRAPYDVYVHDYAWFCPRITLTAEGDRYCGEPGGAPCAACVVGWLGHFASTIGTNHQ